MDVHTYSSQFGNPVTQLLSKPVIPSPYEGEETKVNRNTVVGINKFFFNTRLGCHLLMCLLYCMYAYAMCLQIQQPLTHSSLQL